MPNNFYQKNKIQIYLFFLFIIVTTVSAYVAFSPETIPLSTPMSTRSPTVAIATTSPEVRLQNNQPVQNKKSQLIVVAPTEPVVSTSSEEHVKVPVADEKEIVPTSLTIDSKTFTTNVPEKSSVYSLMKKMTSEHPEFTFFGREYGALGFFVEEIDGVKNNNNTKYYWTLYVNGVMSNLGVSSYIIQPHDVITWKYEKE